MVLICGFLEPLCRDFAVAFNAIADLISDSKRKLRIGVPGVCALSQIRHLFLWRSFIPLPFSKQCTKATLRDVIPLLGERFHPCKDEWELL